MHELSLLASVVQAVQRSVGGADVVAVGLRVGSLSGAVPEALEGAWPIAIDGTSLAGSRLEIEPVAATIWCAICEAEQPVDEYFALTCPECGTPTGNLVHGREFEVCFADVEPAGHC